jgi:hypothetical protein
MSSLGKTFEKYFKEQVKEQIPDSFVFRLYDIMDYRGISNPCDFFVFDGNQKLFCGFELKSTKGKAVSFQRDKDDKNQRMIKYHQIKGLSKIAKYEGAIAGFIINFRDEQRDMERSYFLRIEDFNNFRHTTTKNSINEIEIIKHGAIKIEGKKLRKYYIWDIEKLLKEIIKI